MFDVRTFTLSGITPIPVLVRAETAPSGGIQFTCPGATKDWIRDMGARIRGSLRTLNLDDSAVLVTVECEVPVLASKVPSAAVFAAVLGAMGQVPPSHAGAVVVADVSFQGEVHPVRGVFQALRTLSGQSCAIVAANSASEAAAIEMNGGPFVKTAAVRTARALWGVLQGHALGASPALDAFNVVPVAWKAAPSPVRDAGEMTPGQAAILAQTIAAPAAYPVVLWTMPHASIPAHVLARRALDVLPPLTEAEAVDLTAIYSAAGALRNGPITMRPFRAPHHTVSSAGMVGGSAPAVPGEVSLAHAGVLFLDEIVESRGLVVEALVRVLRAGESTICRTGSRSTFPARPRLVIARTFTCPCIVAPCRCNEERCANYAARAQRIAPTVHIAPPFPL